MLADDLGGSNDPDTFKRSLKSFRFNLTYFCDIESGSCLSVLISISVLKGIKDKGIRICLTWRYLCNFHQTLPLPLTRIARNAAATIDPTLNLFTRYPLLFGGRRQCGFKACPRRLHLTGSSEIEPQTPRSRIPRLNHSVTRSCNAYIIILLVLSTSIYFCLPVNITFSVLAFLEIF